MKKNRIVITGMGIVSCLGDDVDQFYQRLLNGESGISKIESFDCSEYPCQIAGEIKNFSAEPYLDKKLARRVDKYIAYAAVAGKKSLEQAGIDCKQSEQVDKKKCGILVGSGMGGMATFSEGVQTLLEKSHQRVSPFFVPHILTNMAGAILAIDTGFMGINYAISTACATANHCIINAANHIRQGKADLMLCGGVEAPLIPMGLAGFVACKALSKQNQDPHNASKPWDKQRDGFVMSEGAAVLVLESLEHAQKRGAKILAEYLGGAFSCDAHHITKPHSDGIGVSLCIEKALQDAQIKSEQINYINAHATSTPTGDMIEITALKKVFDENCHIKMNASKSMIGHSLGAAAGMEAIACVKAIETGYLHPNPSLNDPEEDLFFQVVGKEKESFEVIAALSNSFGFGGHNASLIIAPYNK